MRRPKGLAKGVRSEAPSGGDPADDLPIDEAERTPLQANGGSNGNGEVCTAVIR